MKTTPGVVAELHRWVQAAGQQAVAPGFWDLATRAFEQLGIEERALALGVLSPPIVAELGPVDAGVLEVARVLVLEGRRATVLTNDLRLVRRCHAERIDAEPARDLLERLRSRR